MAARPVARRLRCLSSSTSSLLTISTTTSQTSNSRHWQHEPLHKIHRRSFHASTCLSKTGQRPNRRHPVLTAATITQTPSRARQEEEQKQMGGKNIARLDLGALELPIRPIDFWYKAPGYLFSGKYGRRYLFNIIRHRIQAIGQPALMRRELYGSIWPSRQQDRGVIGPWTIFPRFTNPRVRNILSTAKSHYKLMNRYTASGLEDGLETVCQVGLEQELSERIRSQRRGQTMEWSLVDSKGNLTTDSSALKAKLMHIRAAAMGYSEGQPPLGIQEAVIYLSGEEALIRKNSSGKVVQEQRRKTSDYMIMQRRIVDKSVEPWYIHGMKQPTTFERWSEEQERAEENDKNKGTTRWWSGLTSYL